MDLKFSTHVVEGVTVVDLSGRIVLGEEAALLRDSVKELLAKSPKIVLNLKNVSYIDSGGLGTLVSVYTSAKNANAAVKLSQLAPKVDTLLQVTKLLTVFDVYDSDEAAVKSF